MVKSKAKKAKAKAKAKVSPSSSSSSSSPSTASSSSSSCIPAKPIPAKSRRRRNKIAKESKKTNRVKAIKDQRISTTTDEKMQRDPFHPCNSNECNWCSEVFFNDEARRSHQLKKYPKLQCWCPKKECGCVFSKDKDVRLHLNSFRH